MSWRPGGNGTLAIKDSDGNEHLFRKLQSYTYTPGTAPTETEQTLDEGEETTVGVPGSGEYAFTFQPHPGRRADREAVVAHRSGNSVTLVHKRARAKTRVNGSDGVRELAITPAGVLTATGSEGAAGMFNGTQWTEGLGLVFGDKLFIIESFGDDAGANKGTKATVSFWGTIAAKKAPEADLSTAIANIGETHSWSLVELGVEIEYTGRLSIAGGDEGSGAGAVTGSSTCVLSTPRVQQMVVP